MEVLLAHGAVLPTPDRVIKDGFVLIRDNRIAEVGAGKHPSNADVKVDCREKLVLPGLIDAHVHMVQSLLRGAADGLSLIPWLRERIWPLEGYYNKELARLSAQLCCIEMIRSGTTTAVECLLPFYFDEVARVVDEIGLRAVLSRTLMDSPGYASTKDVIPASMIETGDNSMRETLRSITRWHGKAENRIHVWFGPRTPGACSPSFYREIGEQARERGVGVTIHLAEVQKDIDYIHKEYGLTPIQFMEDCGLAGPHVIYAHGIWLPPEDFQRLKEDGSTVCHCPASNLKLASGFAPIPELIGQGVNVALGCDGAPCNNTYDMIREMRLAALIHKGRLLDPTVIPAEKVIEMATLNGARALSRDWDIGSIKEGALADLITIDLRKPHLVPVRDPRSTLVYAASGADVDTVIVDGRILMEGRRLKSVDEGGVLERVRERAAEIDDAFTKRKGAKKRGARDK